MLTSLTAVTSGTSDNRVTRAMGCSNVTRHLTSSIGLLLIRDHPRKIQFRSLNTLFSLYRCF